MYIKRCTTLKPFLFSRGVKHYARFFIPTELREHFGKKYLVFSLGSGAGHEIRLKAHQLEHELTNHCNKLLQNAGMNFPISKLDLVFPTGLAIRNINNDADMRRANKLIAQLHALKALAPTAEAPAPVPAPAPVQEVKGLKLIGLVDKFFLLKSHTPATALAYKNCAKEFQTFLKNPNIADVIVSDITRYQEYLAQEKKNSTKTIDNKTGVLRSLFNFAIKQGYYFNENPAKDRALLTKKQRMAGGYEKFELEEVIQIFTSEKFKLEKDRDPDFYYLCLLGLITGCRVGELSSLTKSDFKQTRQGTDYISIKDAKTQAGNRSVPFTSKLYELGLRDFIDSRKQDAVFKYTEREGKGAGNASGKKFSRLLETLKLKREKLVFHSLRKFLNDYLLKNDVQYEPRCQYIGHEIADTNVSIYSKDFTEDELLKYVEKSQLEILEFCKF